MQNLIVLTWGEIRDRIFTEAVQTLMGAKLPLQVTKRLFILAKKINEQADLCRDVQIQLRNQYMKEIKEEGKPDRWEVIEETKEEYYKKLDEMPVQTFKTGVPKFFMRDFNSVDLAVAELLAIKPLLLDGEELSLEKESTPATTSVEQTEAAPLN